jgi:hypothetical protein
LTYLVLFYNSLFGWLPSVQQFASVPGVTFTSDRRLLRQADAVVFHLPQARNIRDAPKYPGQLWVGWSMESRANTPIRKERVMAAFDLHMGFERESDVWHPYVPSLPRWNEAMARPPIEPSQTAPAVLFQSSKIDNCGREAYLSQLMSHLHFDSYGKFLKNRELPEPDAGPETKLALLRDYRFTLAFENTMEPDYVTEKFFQPLLAGSVPVYRGAPNVADFAPGEHCYIDASHYSPAELSQLLQQIASNPAEYTRYQKWRTEPLRPAFLQLLERNSAGPIEQLAAVLQERLDARGPRPDGPPVFPFGVRGYAIAMKRRLVSAVRRFRDRLRGRNGH